MNDALSYLKNFVTVKIDRPMGSKHPDKGFLYPINYGYIPNTIGLDGEEVDAYVLGVFEPIEEFAGDVIAVIHRINDSDDKLIVGPSGIEYSDEQIRALTEFRERNYESIILR